MKKIIFILFILLLFKIPSAIAFGECSEYGYMAQYDYFTNTCKCPTGYYFDESYLGTTCKSVDSLCKEKFGYSSIYNSLSDSCECSYGKELSKRKFGGGYECTSCFSKYGLNSSYNFLSKSCECNSGYTLDSNNQCVEKQNNVYFRLKELNTDDKEAIVKSNYDNRYYHIKYGSGCYNASFRRYLNNDIVINLGTDFDLDRYDRIVLQDDDEVCDITYREKVYSDFTLEAESDYSNLYFNNLTSKTQEQEACETVGGKYVNLLGNQTCGFNTGYIDFSKNEYVCFDGFEKKGDDCVKKIAEAPQDVSNFKGRFVNGKMTLSWRRNRDAVGYYVFYDQKEYQSIPEDILSLPNIKLVKSTRFITKKLNKGATYYFYIAAISKENYLSNSWQALSFTVPN